MELQFKGKFVISAKIVCKTGLHIGGSNEGFEIAGLDNPVIKDPLTGYPYIPGSSIKGKLRHLLEWSLGRNEHTGKPHHFKEDKSEGRIKFGPCNCGRCPACVVFGWASEKKSENTLLSGPTRLTVRDAFPSNNTVKGWESALGEKVYTEIKTENALDRVTSEANPRPLERVPKDSEFDFEALFDVYEDEDKNRLKAFFRAMHLLEDSALGGSGSRGSGRISFKDIAVEYRPVLYYRSGSGVRQVDLASAKTVQSITSSFETIDWQL